MFKQFEDIDNGTWKGQAVTHDGTGGCGTAHAKGNSNTNSFLDALTIPNEGHSDMMQSTPSPNLPILPLHQIQTFLEHMAKKLEGQMAQILARLQQIEFSNTTESPSGSISMENNAHGQDAGIQADETTAKEHSSITFSIATSGLQQQQKDKENNALIQKEEVGVYAVEE